MGLHLAGTLVHGVNSLSIRQVDRPMGIGMSSQTQTSHLKVIKSFDASLNVGLIYFTAEFSLEDMKFWSNNTKTFFFLPMVHGGNTSLSQEYTGTSIRC